MNWSQQDGNGLLIIKLSGEIDLQQSPKLRQILQTKIHDRVPVLLLDFTEVKYIDSSGLATLVEYFKNARAYSGRLAVAGLSNRVRSIFDLVRLNEIFGIYPGVAEAQDALRAQPEKVTPT